MATIDLGKIKLVWKGAYSGGTAYTVDDVVQHTDGGVTSSFICTTNSTGNAPSTGGSVHSSWAYLAKGHADTVSTTLTTQGDVLYRDGSGLQRLAKGTAAQVLKMNAAANAPEWGNLSSDYVKIGTYTANNVASLVIDNIFTTTYSTYKIFIDRMYGASNGAWLGVRHLSSGTTDTNNVYATIQGYAYVESGTQGYASGNSGWHSSSDQGYLMLGSSDASYRGSAEMTIYNPANSDGDADRLRINFKTAGWNGTGRFETRDGAFWINNTSAPTGLEFRYSGHNFYGKWRVYGIK